MNTPDEGSRWARLRAAVGPAAAGLLGGGLTGLVGISAMGTLVRNVGATYAQYPSLHHSCPTFLSDPPQLLVLLAVIVGLAAPVAVGAAAVWAARPRDAWADLSVGVSAALAATLAAFVTCLGWPVVLALVVVPSISDLTLLGDSAKAPLAEGIHPSQPLAKAYPDLQRVEPDRRGGTHMAKIVSDQVTGAMFAAGLGVLMALLTAGALALCGTMAAGYLSRRGDRWRWAAVPYLELTLPLAVTTGLLAAAVLSPVFRELLGPRPFGVGPISLAGLVVVSTLILAGVVRRWPWLPRLCLGLTWVLLLAQAWHSHIPWPLPMAAAVLTAVVLVRIRIVGPQAVSL